MAGSHFHPRPSENHEKWEPRGLSPSRVGTSDKLKLRWSTTISALIEEIREKIEGDKFSRFMGIRLVELREGYSKVAMTVTSDMINFHGIAHGGAIFALADAAFAAASNSHGQRALALCMSISYRSPAREGMELMAEAFEESLGGRTALYRIAVRSEDGTLIASCQGTVYRKAEEKI